MKIVDKKGNITLFKNVDMGEVFKVSDDSSTYAYIKTTSITDNDDGSIYNAACLNDGDLLSFSDEDRVFTYPYSELIIKR